MSGIMGWIGFYGNQPSGKAGNRYQSESGRIEAVIGATSRDASGRVCDAPSAELLRDGMALAHHGRL